MDEQARLDLEDARDAVSRIEYLAADPDGRFGLEILGIASSASESIGRALNGAAPKAAAKPKPKAARKPRAPKPAATAAASGDVSDRGREALALLSKDGPADKTKLALGVLGDAKKAGPVMRTVRKLIADELVEDNDGFYRLTEKGWDAAQT